MTQTLALALLLAALLVLLGAVVSTFTPAGLWFALRATLLFALTLVVFIHFLPEHLPQTDLGPANRVTLVRLALTTLMAGCLGERDEGIAWLATGAGGIALVLDGLDGWLARRRGCASALGARFDMETDALLILVLAILVWQFDKANVWILLAGFARYGFVLAAMVWPWMNAPLPPSMRRKTVCVIQGLTLLVALAPVVTAPASQWVAYAGLLVLCYSFAVDIDWLRRNSRVAHRSA